MRRSLLSSLAAVALLAGGASAAVPVGADAATPSSRHGVSALAASTEYLVYARGTATSKDEAVPGALFFRTRRGAAHRLAVSLDLRLAQADIAGSMLVYQPDATSSPSTLSWRDLAAGTSGTLERTRSIALPDGSTVTAEYRAPAPGGWVLEAIVRGADHLYLQTPEGALRDLGAPEPGGDSLDDEGRPDLDDHLKVRTSRTALVVTASDDETYSNGSASVMTFAKPGRYTRLVGLGHSPSCLGVTTRFVACSVVDTPSARQRLYSTSGRLLVKTRQAGDAFVAGSALAVQTPTSRTGRPWISLTAPGGRTRLMEADLRARGRSGLGGLIVSRGSRTWGAAELAVLTSTGAVHPLVEADRP